jgi:ubiquinone/menaquinone biosynthesis C-methylase UbiE
MNINDIDFTYSRNYDLASLRGQEECRPWDIFREINQLGRQQRLLDIGCGTAAKLLHLASDFDEVVGLEPNSEMRRKAEEEVERRGLSNIKIVDGAAEHLPFGEDYFDVVTCMLAPHITTEIYRVLKPSGRTIVEKIGERDKANIKVEFGSDEEGPRGYLMGYKEGEREAQYQKEFEDLFSETKILSGRWKTWYSPDGLLDLIENAKTVRRFDREKDQRILHRIIDKYMTEKGIETEQHRILIMAKNNI